MTYEYRCLSDGCGQVFDVIKSVRHFEDPEICPNCKSSSQRAFAPRSVYFSGTKVEDAEYNPGLGCITKSKKHRNELAKQKGLIEVGNEKPETIHKHFDGERKHRWEKSWEDSTKGWVGCE